MPSFLQRKIFGRIPTWYVLLGLALILAVVAWRMRPATEANADTVATDAAAVGVEDVADTVDVTPNVDSTGGFVANPQPTVATAPTVGNDQIADNQEWYRRSVDFLVQGGSNALSAQTALGKYLEGDALSYAEGEMVNKAVKQFGTPPEVFKPGGQSAKPAAAAQRQGPLPRTHVVKGPNDNTYVKLASLYYSDASVANVNLIKAENTPNGLSGNGPWPVGTGVRIPKFITPAYFTSNKRDNTLSEIARKNARSQSDIVTLNPGMKFPVKPGTRVRVK